MRPLQMLTIAASFACLAWLHRRRRGSGRLVTAARGGLGVLVGAQLLIEGYSWQMAPAYLVALSVLPAGLWRDRKTSGGPGHASCSPRAAQFVRVALLAVSVAAIVLFPHFTLPRPTGEFAVGTTYMHFTDEDREETCTAEPTDRRKICGRIWYPATKPHGARPVSYAPDAAALSRILTKGTPAPCFVFAHLGLVRAHAFQDAPPASRGGELPIVIFSHAYWAGLSQSTVLMQELASHGYVVVSIAHAYETPYGIDRSGRLYGYDPRNRVVVAAGVERRQALPLERALTGSRSLAEDERLLRRIQAARPRTLESLETWTADISATIDELQAWNSGGSILAGRLDTDRVGVVGHSFGGAAAGQACLDDPRCVAGVNIDGLQLGDMLDHPLSRPFMFIHHDNTQAANKTPNRLHHERAIGPSYLIRIKDTGHLSFCDLALQGRYSLVRSCSPMGTIDGERGLRLTNDCIRSFMDAYVARKVGAAITCGADVSLQSRNVEGR